MIPLTDGTGFFNEAQSENDFMKNVIEYAEMCGWLVYHTHIAKRSTEGWPDLAMARRVFNGADEVLGARLVFAELKREIPANCTPGRLVKFNPTPAQQEWLDVLGWVGGDGPIPTQGGVEAYLWRPSSWPEIERVLA